MLPVVGKKPVKLVLKGGIKAIRAAKFARKWLFSKKFRKYWKKVNKYAKSGNKGFEFEAEVAKRYKDRLERFSEDIYYDAGGRITDVDVELDDVIIECTISEKGGKKWRKMTKGLPHIKVNPSGKKLILFAPELLRLNKKPGLVKRLRDAGVAVIGTYEDLDKLLGETCR
ncbi:MAG: hypothetical protein GY760_21665 [Deltaproteobacteria bacterium]|nr:hypothetical protein [Deltaproteobacteria bacterium]